MAIRIIKKSSIERTIPVERETGKTHGREKNISRLWQQHQQTEIAQKTQTTNLALETNGKKEEAQIAMHIENISMQMFYGMNISDDDHFTRV